MCAVQSENLRDFCEEVTRLQGKGRRLSKQQHESAFTADDIVVLVTHPHLLSPSVVLFLFIHNHLTRTCQLQ